MSNNLLIVDDSASVRQMIEATLKSASYTVTSAKDGKEALDLCKTKRFDFVLTDQNMPRMDGLTLIKSLRALDAYKRTPLIMLTTEAGDAMKAQGKAVGATGWMVKPFDPKKLLQVVAKVLN
ncbi:MAG: response regulator [Marinomonas sp.]|jgi:two-component system chemotaxis response regulator CheY|uniref:response regulator n=1 Tax=unclassified Marinomonas TaxID=196814 RepID=UPI0005F9E1C8|nr:MULTISPECIES: response regulator [unclassified Marinomonas]KJZ14333.1 Fis family transcriptional regulator [Marinomonas sp. S3726]KZM44097.1 Fis family transcriptional regulator [Marinomonas sp. SBI22]KZM45257.1 Fis family transcriptional regulator [Marinomonas sp. SBI8L]